MDDHAALMTTFALFEGYTTRGAEALIERGQIRQYAQGEVLYAQGTRAVSVVLVLEGMVEHFVSQDGREIGLGTAGPSHVLADVQVLADTAHPTSARATQDVVVLEWDRDAFGRLVASDTVFSQRVIHQTAQSLAEQAESLIASMAAIKS